MLPRWDPIGWTYPLLDLAGEANRTLGKPGNILGHKVSSSPLNLPQKDWTPLRSCLLILLFWKFTFLFLNQLNFLVLIPQNQDISTFCIGWCFLSFVLYLCPWQSTSKFWSTPRPWPNTLQWRCGLLDLGVSDSTAVGVGGRHDTSGPRASWLAQLSPGGRKLSIPRSKKRPDLCPEELTLP